MHGKSRSLTSLCLLLAACFLGNVGCTNGSLPTERIDALEVRLADAKLAWSKVDWWCRESITVLTEAGRQGRFDDADLGRKIRDLRARMTDASQWETEIRAAVEGCGPEILRVREQIDSNAARGEIAIQDAQTLADRLTNTAAQMSELAKLGDSTAGLRSAIGVALEQASMATTKLQSPEAAMQAIQAMQDSLLGKPAPEAWKKLLQ